MKIVQLTKGYVALVDDCDFVEVCRFSWHVLTSKKSVTFYAARHEPGNHRKIILMHQQILGYKGVDHINGKGWDNRRENLRPATLTEQQHNKAKRRDNSSGFIGVVLRKGRWIAQIQNNKKNIYLGSFDTPVEAARAYDTAARLTRGTFATLNFI